MFIECFSLSKLFVFVADIGFACHGMQYFSCVLDDVITINYNSCAETHNCLWLRKSYMAAAGG